MLCELHITDLALIERVALDFGSGLNVITGETGAGKSLLIDALELLRGSRARSSLVRRGASEARVEGRFLLAPGGYGREALAWIDRHLPQARSEQGGENGELELILTRTIGRDGRSRAHVNHRPVTQRILRELAARLVEIHGQNQQQILFDPEEQCRLLDSFGELEEALAGYRERRERWLGLRRRLESFDDDEAGRLERLDLVSFQVGELDEADPPEEEELAALRCELQGLRHAEELSARFGTLLEELSRREGAALDVVRRAERELESWEERVDSLAGPAEAMREASAHLEEAVGGLSSFLASIEADPRRLEELEQRLGELERLARKYRVTPLELASLREDLAEELARLEETAGGREELSREEEKARRSAEQAAARLTRARRGLRKRLAQAVESGLADLGLGAARFDVALLPLGDPTLKGLGPRGAERVEFQLAANPGEAMGPLTAVASGGEAARILLALRGALAVRQSTPTLVFDEVDAGVGGRLGPRVAEHLAALSRHHQVFCVTHLPSIAAVADRHLRVQKATGGGRTRTQVSRLEGPERVEEIADMIAGGKDQATALAEAARLLGSASTDE